MAHEPGENIPDPIDRAALEADAANQEALHNQRQRSLAEMPAPKSDGMCVEDCGEPVEEGRLKVGLGRCLSCQQDHETAMRRYRGAR